MPDQGELSKKDLLDSLLSQLSEFVMVLLSPDGQFISWHPGVQQQFGYSQDEFIGQSIEVLFPLAERFRGAGRRELERAIDSGRVTDTRWLVRKSGQPILVEGVTIPLRDAAGKLAGFGKVARDVTERRTAEDNLKALASALDHSTVIVRRWDGTINHWTAGCEKLYGWTAQEAVGYIEHELLNTTLPVRREEIERQLLNTGTWIGELQHKRRDGSSVPIATQWVLLKNHSDEFPIVIETHTDISGRLKAQQELQAANARLQAMTAELARSNEELEEFARITSHDLSAPITSTRWLVELIASRHAGQLDEQGRDCLRRVSLGLARMADLVEAVLTHARVGTIPIASLEPACAEDSLRAAVENLQKDIDTVGAVITHDPMPELRIEPQALNQLLQNLLSNALKYRRPDVPPRVHVSADQLSATEEGALWRIAVKDNGLGIEAEWFHRIFQPLQRRHGAEIEGSGIGLATCKKIVTRAGGQIWVESQVGSGSTFFFTIPGVAARPAE
jgi:PAS domain S-box-containing protein